MLPQLKTILKEKKLTKNQTKQTGKKKLENKTKKKCPLGKKSENKKQSFPSICSVPGQHDAKNIPHSLI